MKGFFSTLLDYNYQMNHKIMHKILDNNGVNDDVIKLFSHIIHAQMIWLARFKGENDKNIPLWENIPLADIDKLMTQNHSEWVNFVKGMQEEDFHKNISYTNTQGNHYTNKMEDILYHMINHATHHRAQISTLLRQNGITPPVTDYIAYAREHKLLGQE